MTVRMDRLDEAVILFLTSELLDPERLEALLAPLLVQRDAWADRRQQHVAELRDRAAETKLRRLYDAVEKDVLSDIDRMFKDRVAELNAIRDQAEIDADRIAAMVGRKGPVLAVQDPHHLAAKARSNLRGTDRGGRRALVRSLLQRVEVAGKHEARVQGSCIALMRALAAASGTKLARTGFGGLGEPDDNYVFPVAL